MSRWCQPSSKRSSSPACGGLGEVPKRELTEREAAGILRRELDDLTDGISAADRHGNVERADKLKAQRTVLAAYVRE